MLVGGFFQRSMRYGKIFKLIDGISQRTLTQTLKGLEREGLVTRTLYPIPPRVDYALAERGPTLIPPVVALRGRRTIGLLSRPPAAARSIKIKTDEWSDFRCCADAMRADEGPLQSYLTLLRPKLAMAQIDKWTRQPPRCRPATDWQLPPDPAAAGTGDNCVDPRR
jgi:HxlR-like helix-turn-helix